MGYLQYLKVQKKNNNDDDDDDDNTLTKDNLKNRYNQGIPPSNSLPRRTKLSKFAYLCKYGWQTSCVWNF